MIRNNRKYHFIYKTINLINNKFYIGMHSTDNLNDGYVGSGRKLWLSIKKYGKENFKIEHIEFYKTRDELIQREIELVNEEILEDPLCMNLMVGGKGGWVSVEVQTKATNAARIKLKKLWLDDIWRMQVCEKRKNITINNHKLGKYKYIATFVGKHHSKETIEKIKLSLQGKQTGEKNSQFGTCWITNGKENKKIKKQNIIPEGWKLGRMIRKDLYV